MSSAVAAVVGAGLGAGATLIVSVVNARFQARREATAWERERKQAAYYGATRALLRVRNRRRRLANSPWSDIPKEELLAHLDDVVDAQHGLSMLLVVCGEQQRAALRGAVESYDRLVDDMLDREKARARRQEISTGVDNVWSNVLDAERADIGTPSLAGGSGT